MFCFLTPLKHDLTAASTPPKTTSSCTATGTWMHTKHIREREGRQGHAGKCRIFTWLRSCSKELSPDLLIDPELVSATLTRAAGNKVSGCVLFWRKQCIITINMICVFYDESQADTQTGPHLCILAADCRWTEQSEQFEEKQLKQNQPDYWNINR